MQINNNPSRQNFGMALKINPNAIDALKSKPAEYLERLAKAGEILADTKHWDVEVLNIPKTNQLGYVVKGKNCANAYLDTIRCTKAPEDEFLTIQAKWAGTEGLYGHSCGEKCETVMKMANADVAKQAYAKISSSEPGLENAVESVKVLDEWTTYKKAVEEAEKKDMELRSEMVDELFTKYGINQ